MAEFTATIFHEAFSTLGKLYEPKVFDQHIPDYLLNLFQVLYPTIVIPNSHTDGDSGLIEYTKKFKYLFVSLNRFDNMLWILLSSSHSDGFRFERKKNIELALQAFTLMVSSRDSGGGGVDKKDVLLVIAGGFDTRILENVEYHKVMTSTFVAIFTVMIHISIGLGQLRTSSRDYRKVRRRHHSVDCIDIFV